MLNLKKDLLLIGVLTLSAMILPVNAQSIDQLGKQMAKQVNAIRSSNSATMTSPESSSDEDTQALIAGIPRPKSQNRTSNLSLNREYFSDFVGPIGVGKIFVPLCNPKCTMSDVRKYMTGPNIEQDDANSLSYTLYSSNAKNEDDDLATYTYMFINGSYMGSTIVFHQGVDRDKCLAWMVKHYEYKDSEVDNGMDIHVFTTNDGKVRIMVSFISTNDTSSTVSATITYTKTL